MNSLGIFVLFTLLVASSCEESNSTLLHSKIFGGEDAVQGSYTYAALIKYKTVHHSSAVLISELFVLTSGRFAYNIEKAMYSDFYIFVGSVNTKEATIREIAEIIMHPAFPKDYANGHEKIPYADLAALRMNDSVVFSENLRAVELHNEDVCENYEAAVLGWGSTGHPIYSLYRSDMSEKLKILQVVTTNNFYCNTVLQKNVEKFMLCAESPLGTLHVVRHGDEGAPLVNKYGKLIGILSYIVSQKGIPAVYTRVSTFFDFINAFKNRPNLQHDAKRIRLY